MTSGNPGTVSANFATRNLKTETTAGKQNHPCYRFEINQSIVLWTRVYALFLPFGSNLLFFKQLLKILPKWSIELLSASILTTVIFN